MSGMMLDADWLSIVFRACWQAAVLFVFVSVTLFVLRDRIAPKWRFVLWSLVLVRLAFVVTPSSDLSAFNLVRLAGTTTTEIVLAKQVNPPTVSDPRAVSPSSESFEPAIDRNQSPTIEPLVEEIVIAVDRNETESTAVAESGSLGKTQTTTLLSSQASGIDLARWLFAIWLIGCLFFVARLVVVGRRLGLLLQSCSPLSCEFTENQLAELSQQMGIKKTPVLLVSPTAHSPFLAGVFRPRVVLPESMLDSSDPCDTKFVLAHELAHIRRHDVLVQWLSIAVRTVYWFHPLVWATCTRMQVCRESACDDLVIHPLSDADRIRYGKTLLKLASQLQPPPLAPGLCGWFSRNSVQHRIIRLARVKHPTWMQTIMSVGLIGCVATFGLTDTKLDAVAASPTAQNPVENDDEPAAEPALATPPNKGDFVAKGRLISGPRPRTPVANAKVRLFEVRGLGRKYREIGATVTNQEGRYQFTGLERPNQLHFQSLEYRSVMTAEGHPTAVSGGYYLRNEDDDIPRLYRAGVGSLSGQVVDETDKPISGATVRRDYGYKFVPPGLEEFVTKMDGTFVLTDIPAIDTGDDTSQSVSIIVSHPDYMETQFRRTSLKFAKLVLNPGCAVDGSVVIDKANQPLAGAFVRAIPTDYKSGLREQSVMTDAAGKFHLVLENGDYELMMEAEGHEWVAKLASLECRNGTPIQLDPIKATRGGWITGQLINTKTGKPQPMTYRDKQKPVKILLTGSGRPHRAQGIMAVLDAEGRFKIRACPGDNYPYLYNIRGSRLSWTINKVEPVVVREGQTSECLMTFTPELTTTEKIAVGRKVFDELPKETLARVDAIIAEFRKLNHTVDECETWCLLMKELASIGKPAVSALCAELDRTDDQRMLRRLAFALRAIGDPNSVPALIRALPKTLQPSMSDYGLIVVDPKLASFMRQHQIKRVTDGGRGVYFNFGRPMREMRAALQLTTMHKISGTDLANITLRKDKRAAEAQRKIYHSKAKLWAEWWNANSSKFDVTAENRTAHLPDFVATDLSSYPTGLTLTENATSGGGWSGFVVTPIGDADHRSDFFLDLDSWRSPRWPKELPLSDNSDATVLAATEWAAKRGIDLICVAGKKDDGTVTYTLAGVGLQVWEIDRFDADKLNEFVQRGELPKGRKLVDNLLRHQNARGELESAKRSCFLYLTREQNLGVIRIADFVTTARNVTGMPYTPQGVGFNRGVRFNIKSIAR